MGKISENLLKNHKEAMCQNYSTQFDWLISIHHIDLYRIECSAAFLNHLTVTDDVTIFIVSLL